MTVINRSALVPYTANEMYDLVADIESYPEFLPWCAGARVLSSEADTVVAELEIKYKNVHKSFTTKNKMTPNQSMLMDLLEGPFKHLRGDWQFQALDESACKISLELDFAFSNKLIGLAMGPVFANIANTFVDSFRQRAETVYGKR